MRHRPILLTCTSIGFGFGVLATLQTHAAEDPKSIVLNTPGLVAFWTFGEEAGQPRVSTGTKEKHPLQEVGGPIARVEGGPFSGYSAEFNGKQYFRIPHAETGDLNIGGPGAQVSMFAVVRIVNLKQSRTIAGMWSEGKGANDDTGTRQYALLMNMPTYGGPRQLTPHISSEGGVTRRADGSAFPWCADYAATKSEVAEEKWCSLGFTYDGEAIRAYINGVLDARPLDAVKDKRTDPYFTQEGPGGKDRGMNPYYHGRGIFRYDPAKHSQTKPMGGSDFTVGARYAVGKMLGESTIGRFGGLAVFNRAITDAEMQKLHDAANVAALPEPPPTSSQATTPPAASKPSNVVGPVAVMRVCLADELQDFSRAHAKSAGLKLNNDYNALYAEYLFRAQGSTNDWITYQVPTDIESVKLVAFFANEVTDFAMQASSDGKVFASLKPERKERPLPSPPGGAAGAQRRTMVEYECRVPAGKHFLKVLWNSPAELDRVEIFYR